MAPRRFRAAILKSGQPVVIHGAIPGVSELPRRGEIVLLHTGAELARIQLRTPPRLVFPDASEEIHGLPQAAAAAGKVRALAEARAARVPQLDLFGKRSLS